MQRAVAPIIAALGLLAPGGVEAQERSFRDDIGNLFEDAWYVVRAPAHATAQDWQGAGIVAGMFGIGLLIDEPVHAWLRAHPESLPVKLIEPFREPGFIAVMGRTRQFLVPMSLVLYGSGLAFDHDDLRDAGLGCITSNVTTTLTRSLTSLLIGRLRPRNDEGAFRFELFAFGDWDWRSFPGGHASNIMSCASYFNHRFDLGAAEPAIWAVAGGVGLARVVDEAHWLSDTLYGMGYGYAVGRTVAARFNTREQRRAEQSLQPGLVIGWRITF